MANRNISFSGNALQTANIIVSDIDSESIPDKDARLYTLAHANASSIPFTSYPSKTIKISGYVIGSSVADCDAQLDTFRGFLINPNSNLDIDYNGITRRWTATVNTVSIQRPGGLTFANFSVEFLCTTPFGINTTATIPSSSFSPSATGRTASTYNDTYAFLGTAPWQLPVVTITLTAVTGGTNQYITWGNGGNGQAITVQRTWANGDILVIDSVQKTVTVNGNAVNFTGAFPEFPPGSQVMQYTDSFTTRTFTEVVSYNIGWL